MDYSWCHHQEDDPVGGTTAGYPLSVSGFCKSCSINKSIKISKLWRWQWYHLPEYMWIKDKYLLARRQWSIVYFTMEIFMFLRASLLYRGLCLKKYQTGYFTRRSRNLAALCRLYWLELLYERYSDLLQHLRGQKSFSKMFIPRKSLYWIKSGVGRLTPEGTTL